MSSDQETSYAVQVRQDREWRYIPHPGNPNTPDILKARLWEDPEAAREVAFMFDTGRVVEVTTSMREIREYQPRRLRRYRW